MHWQIAHVFCILFSHSGMKGRGKQVQEENTKQILGRVSFSCMDTPCVKDTTLSRGFFYWSVTNKQI